MGGCRKVPTNEGLGGGKPHPKDSKEISDWQVFLEQELK
jgi:hypothetical protein